MKNRRNQNPCYVCLSLCSYSENGKHFLHNIPARVLKSLCCAFSLANLPTNNCGDLKFLLKIITKVYNFSVHEICIKSLKQFKEIVPYSNSYPLKPQKIGLYSYRVALYQRAMARYFPKENQSICSFFKHQNNGILQFRKNTDVTY